MNIFGLGSLPSVSSSFQNWVEWACEYDLFRQEVLVGNLDSLSQTEQQEILSIAKKLEIFHEAASKGDKKLLAKLIELKADLTGLDAKGCGVLARVKDPSVFDFLRQKGVLFQADSSLYESLLSFVLQRCAEDLELEQEENIHRDVPWSAKLIEIQKESNPLDYIKLKVFLKKILIRFAEQNPSIKHLAAKALKDLVQTHPDHVIRAIEEWRSDHLRCDEAIKQKAFDYFKKGFFYLLDKGSLPFSFVCQMLKNPFLTEWLFCEDAFLANLKKKWINDDKELAGYIHQADDFKLGLLCYSLHYAASLYEWALLLLRLSALNCSPKGISLIKQQILPRLETLQKKEARTIWYELLRVIYLNDYQIEYVHLLALENYGLDPNWTDPIHQRHLLFTDFLSILTGDYFKKSKVAIKQMDKHGNHALDHYCLRTRTDYQHAKLLVEAGLTLSDHIPEAKLCRPLIDDPYLHTLLCICLMHPRLNVITHCLKRLPSDQIDRLRTVINQHEMIKERIGKLVKAALSNVSILIQASINKSYALQSLAQLWSSDLIPSEVFKLIPGSPLLSLLFAVLDKWSKNSHHYAFFPFDLIINHLRHDEIVLMNKFLFEHPTYMRLFVKHYFQLKSIDVSSGAGAKHGHIDFVYSLVVNMEDLLHIPASNSKLSIPHQKLIKAFKETVKPVVRETLDIPNSADIKILNRTVVVYNGKECEGFKFKKWNENYHYFAQEHRVTQAFQEIADQFKSQFHQPIGIYVIKKLPPVLQAYQSQLGGEPAFVYHYKAQPGLFQYVQDLNHEQFLEARKIYLHDAAKMVRKGIYPDLVPLFHNIKQNRRFILLIDLAARLSTHSFNPAGGAGRFEQIFHYLLYPNIRATGITDMRDAAVLWHPFTPLHQDLKGMPHFSEGKIRYFYQMHGLSNILLVDMLLLAERYEKLGWLDWTNQSFLEKFGKQLAEGFALISSVYSDHPIEKWLTFIEQSGLDFMRMTRQIAFWIDTSEKGYRKYILEEKIPPDLYEPDAEISLDGKSASNFNAETGCSTKGQKDIGFFNGPSGLTEFEKLAYLVYMPISLAEPFLSKDDGNEEESSLFCHYL